MSAPSDDEVVGYKRPPKTTQWKKGQCGNPTRQYKPKLRSFAELIDTLLAETISIVENGVHRRVSTFEAIFFQLVAQELSGNRRATRVRLRYQDFVGEQGGPREIIVRHESPEPSNEPPLPSPFEDDISEGIK